MYGTPLLFASCLVFPASVELMCLLGESSFERMPRRHRSILLTISSVSHVSIPLQLVAPRLIAADSFETTRSNQILQTNRQPALCPWPPNR
ncbi:hypothetical protein P170DRAFT_439948 [Aspergillus steynii IBT 23096]|uniref:Secreted protein n=1 Tax=Aspergillus steynii IBT 23096 TaxID=1392250 RepID=A0A2I2FVN6_9EURO|nr:uncharacterized protein P170DRAFT_439948 [Aspergillus steynii IBT 23096]PLB44698.1 hypothetical protein P170DRAFT_439948 [Aspergillus steynii IBT 23096]